MARAAEFPKQLSPRHPHGVPCLSSRFSIEIDISNRWTEDRWRLNESKTQAVGDEFEATHFDAKHRHYLEVSVKGSCTGENVLGFNPESQRLQYLKIANVGTYRAHESRISTSTAGDQHAHESGLPSHFASVDPAQDVQRQLGNVLIQPISRGETHRVRFGSRHCLLGTRQALRRAFQFFENVSNGAHPASISSGSPYMQVYIRKKKKRDRS